VLSRPKAIMLAITAGIGISAVLQVLALVAYQKGFAALTQILDWPNTLLQAAFPAVSMNSSINVLAYFASLPLGAAAYAIVAYILLRRRMSHDT